MNIQMVISADARLSDIRALLDSYMVEVLRDSHVVHRSALHYCELKDPPGHDFGPARIDWNLDLRLVRYIPPLDADFLFGIRERSPRWPFFVEFPLAIEFVIDEQWWLFTFTPGREYEERLSPLQPQETR